MHGAQDAVQRACGQDHGRLGSEAVRLTQLDAAQDAQTRKSGAAALEALVVGGDVEQAVAGANVVGEVGVVGEGDRGQPELERAPAAGLHVAARSVPRPLRMDVAVGNQHSGPELTLIGWFGSATS